MSHTALIREKDKDNPEMKRCKGDCKELLTLDRFGVQIINHKKKDGTKKIYTYYRDTCISCITNSRTTIIKDRNERRQLQHTDER